MTENLKNKKVIFCDLDGTLIETISGEKKKSYRLEISYDKSLFIYRKR